MKLTDNIFLGLSKKIDVYIDLKYFKFNAGHNSLTLNTYLYIEKENENWSIASIGETPKIGQNTQRIDLFKGPSDVCKFHALAAFFAHAIFKLTRKRAMIRPTFNCYGIKNLNSVLNGYEEGIIIRALKDAGAMQVNIK